MKRRLMNAYARWLPSWFKRLIPLWFKSLVLGWLYRRTRHPDFGFMHVQLLRRIGRKSQAATLYGAAGTPESTDDPLFKSSLVPVMSGGGGTPARGYFQAGFGYRGLMFGGGLKPTSSPAPTHIDIMLNDILLRREKLSFANGVARFRYIIQRAALNRFPTNAQLKIVTSHGDVLPLSRTTNTLDIHLPHADGRILDLKHPNGLLDKKGALRLTPQDIEQRQDQYLALYSRVQAAFEAAFNKPLLILYGTLLGQHRSGDFIAGDDDFDVGYVSEQTSFAAVKSEAIEMIKALVARGFTISLNREGKLFRITDSRSGPGIYLDNRPVFSPGDAMVWMHKQACLKLDLQGFRDVDTANMRGASVQKPRISEAFLAAYYGAGWATPDPGFSNKTKQIAPEIHKNLATLNLSLAEQRQLIAEFATANRGGQFTPLALRPLYPLALDETPNHI